MTYKVRPYEGPDSDAWDNFCSSAYQATFLHTRKFLSYHGERFRDCSLIVEQGNRIVGLFPAAQHPQDETCMVSHPGITYGGILQQGRLFGERMIEVMLHICDLYRDMGYTKLIYKAVPTVYHKAPAQDDLYAMFRLNAERVRCDLSNAVNLAGRMPVSDRRKRSLKKALKANLKIEESNLFLPKLWSVLADNLKTKHDAKPVHSLKEMLLLSEMFPENIRCICALRGDDVVAGVLLFITSTTHHAQYIASTALGYQISALDAVFEHCIGQAKSSGTSWFDFGISNEEEGRVLNEGLYQFKVEFGGGGIVHEFFQLDL